MGGKKIIRNPLIGAWMEAQWNALLRTAVLVLDSNILGAVTELLHVIQVVPEHLCC